MQRGMEAETAEREESMKRKKQILTGLGILAAVLIAAGALSAALGNGFTPFGFLAAQKPAVIDGTLPVRENVDYLVSALRKDTENGGWR